MKTKKVIANVFVGLVNGACLIGFFSFSPVGFILGGLGALGIIGQVILNK